jgi:hypothetical protein
LSVIVGALPAGDPVAEAVLDWTVVELAGAALGVVAAELADLAVKGGEVVEEVVVVEAHRKEALVFFRKNLLFFFFFFFF